MSRDVRQRGGDVTATPVRPMVRWNKVPEVTVYFWIVKILCTTVGESCADFVNTALGFGLTRTTLTFCAALAVALVVQFRTRRYVPAVYWLGVGLCRLVSTWL